MKRKVRDKRNKGGRDKISEGREQVRKQGRRRKKGRERGREEGKTTVH